MSSAVSRPTASSPQSARWVLPLLIGYAVLALLGGVLHRPELGFAAIVLLPDMLPAVEFRKLRVLLRYARSDVAQGAPASHA